MGHFTRYQFYMASFDQWKPALRSSQRFLHDLEAFSEEFIPQYVLSAHTLEHEDMYAIAEQIARRMVTGLLVNNARSWREAATKSTQGRRIYEMLRLEMDGPTGMIARHIVLDNARLISSLPLAVSQRINRYIAEQQAKGVRSSEITRVLERRVPHMMRSRLRLIARTETAKAESAITQARSEMLGLPVYEWATSKDQRVRKSHQRLDSVLIFWNEPPSPERLSHEKSKLGTYHAGCAPNCRCLSLPLVSLDEVRWPHRVFHSGAVQSMTRNQFLRMNQHPAPRTYPTPTTQEPLYV